MVNKLFVGLIVLVLFAGLVNAIPEGQFVRHLDARLSSGEIVVSGSYFDNRNNSMDVATIRAYCTHNTTVIFLGEETFNAFNPFSNSVDGNVATFYIRSNVTGCVRYDPVWVTVDEWFSNPVNVHKSSRHVQSYNAEDPSGVPEFGTIGLILAIVGTLSVLIYSRRK